MGIKYNSRASLKDGTKILNHCEMGNYVNGKLQGLGFLLNETNEKLGGTNMDVWSVCNFENGEKNGYIYTGNNKVLKMITNFENKKVTENLIFRTDCYYYQNEKYPELRMLSSNLTFPLFLFIFS